ncbi:PREDICTED: dynein light chain 2, cytoplasmic-like isoform X2 [Nelumbo nucifera]|uniref:Dynein light chain n=1 Tax=Nelumbo nucifera TaxID=4432 RepID=A0A1U8AT43_NELNU|nr:PREDICTED: dynein light chain 2, cytoplasmic-like isoform X2 [Nelumbo nucifera]
MMDEAKRGAGFLKPSSDEKSPAASPLGAPKKIIIKSADMKEDMQYGAAKKVVVKSADMKEDMQKEAIECAFTAFEKHSIEKDIAEHIKKEFDKKHGPTWHCIVGRNFGSYVTHETNHFVYFYLDQKAILLFKSG